MKYLHKEERVARIATVLYGILSLLFLWRLYYVRTENVILAVILHSVMFFYFANEWRKQIKKPSIRIRNFTGEIKKKYFALNGDKKQFYYSLYIEELGILKQIQVKEYIYYGDKIGDRFGQDFYSKDFGKTWFQQR